MASSASSSASSTAAAAAALLSSTYAGVPARRPEQQLAEPELLARIEATARARNRLHGALLALNHCPARWSLQAHALVDAGRLCRVLRTQIDELEREMQVLRGKAAANTAAAAAAAASTTTRNDAYGIRLPRHLNLHWHPHRRARDAENARDAAQIQLSALERRGTGLECNLRKAEAAQVRARAELEKLSDRAERADVLLAQLEAIYATIFPADAPQPTRIHFANAHRAAMLAEEERVEDQKRDELIALHHLCAAGAQYCSVLPPPSSPSDPPELPAWHWRRWSKRDRIMSHFAEGVSGYRQISQTACAGNVAIALARNLHVGVRTQSVQLTCRGMPVWAPFASMNLNPRYARSMMMCAKKLREAVAAIDQDLDLLRCRTERTEKSIIDCTRKVEMARVEHVQQWEYWIRSLIRMQTPMSKGYVASPPC